MGLITLDAKYFKHARWLLPRVNFRCTHQDLFCLRLHKLSSLRSNLPLLVCFLKDCVLKQFKKNLKQFIQNPLYLCTLTTLNLVVFKLISFNDQHNCFIILWGCSPHVSFRTSMGVPP